MQIVIDDMNIDEIKGTLSKTADTFLAYKRFFEAQDAMASSLLRTAFFALTFMSGCKTSYPTQDPMRGSTPSLNMIRPNPDDLMSHAPAVDPSTIRYIGQANGIIVPDTDWSSATLCSMKAGCLSHMSKQQVVSGTKTACTAPAHGVI